MGLKEGKNVDLYPYKPNFISAVIAIIMFVFSFSFTLYYFVKKKTWFFFCMVDACLMMLIGTITRAMSIKDQDNDILYIVSYLTIMLCPSVAAAACYMAFGRVVYHVTPEERRNFKNLWVPARFITPIFVILDIIGFLIMFIGLGGMAASVTNDDIKSDPKKLKSTVDNALIALKVGLVLQLICFLIFTLLASRFIMVSKRWRNQWPDAKWRKFALVICAACFFLLIRSVFRVFEFTHDKKSDFFKWEWPIYIFDLLPMQLVFCLFIQYHPSDFLPWHLCGLKKRKDVLHQKINAYPPEDPSIYGHNPMIQPNYSGHNQQMSQNPAFYSQPNQGSEAALHQMPLRH